MNINLIGVPLYFGCDREGVDNAPDVLRANNIEKIFKTYHENFYDLGNLHVTPMKKEDKFSCHKSMKYLSPIIDVNRNLSHAVYSSLSSNSFPLVVGGDHSLGLGSLSGCSKMFKDDLAVIWIDAHGDINTHETSESGNVHGMPLAAAMGIGHTYLTNLYFEGQKVKPENVYIVGARDLDKGEVELINSLNLKVWSTEEVKKIGHEQVIDTILKDLKARGLNNVHLSYDIDALDANLVPGTGTPVHEGLSMNEVKYMLSTLLKSGLIKSMDFVELNTKIDNDDKTLNVALELLELIAKNLK